MFGAIDTQSKLHYFYSSFTLSLPLHTFNQDNVPLRKTLAVINQLLGFSPTRHSVNCDSKTEQ